ncbi:Alpha/beta-hydrolase [Pleurostoma richardsiae]|uniref:Carboxylic ester hydrolase n=1 Tax=Pleurostoma richardsiae TaxID=41990 RepID=A0AA38RKI4_9PEZI|nr:Alpha/beta-hydrolase [Pleurostoma richardsiae]
MFGPSFALFTFLNIAHAASLQKITTDFGDNPRNVGFYIFVPDNLAPKPPILVNPHWCHGDATAAYAGSQYASLASQYGFIVIYPDSPNTVDKCWDVSSAETLSHDGGGDSLGIVSMVEWTLRQYNGDASRVFVTGVSSGAMMTTVLVGAYPDVFAAGSAFSGVPFGCFAPANNSGIYGYWNDDCAKGRVVHTPERWAQVVLAAYPEYSSWRPKMQIFHGMADEVLNYTDFLEEVKQWNAVFGFSQVPIQTILNTPVANWTRFTYGSIDWFEAYSAAGVPHNIQNQELTANKHYELCKSSSIYEYHSKDNVNCPTWYSGLGYSAP